MLNEEFVEVEKKATLNYFKRLFENRDDASLILGAHLYVEHWIEIFLRYLLPEPQKIPDSLTFMQKLALAQSLGFDRNDEFGLAQATKQLNKMRNKIVHDLDYSPTKEEFKRISMIKSNLRKDADKLIDELGLPRVELIAFCITIQGYVAGFIEGKKSREQQETHD